LTPRISVVMPTHNRANLLQLTLPALARQTVPPHEFELVLVADGCTDETTEVVRTLALPISITYLDQPSTGAAAARNRGAAAAKAPLLLFLDDDKEAVPDLLAAHLDAHRRDSGAVVLGYYPIPASLACQDPFTRAVKLWWDDCFTARAAPGYRFTFKDFCSGNVSLAAGLLKKAGGFDERIPGAGGEDYELGVRLLALGARFCFERAAVSHHHETMTFAKMLRRARQEGYAHVRIVERHPELFRSFKLHVLSRLEGYPVAWKLMWRLPWLPGGAAFGLRAVAAGFRKLGAEGSMWRGARVALGHAYWTGVRDAVGSYPDWLQFRAKAEDSIPAPRELDVDLDSDLDRLDAIFEHHCADAVRVLWRGELLGRIEAVPGAERLAGRHVRKLLLNQFPGPMLGVIVDRQLRSEAGIGRGESFVQHSV
jgi:glycosyltransferase involved in cell wall biosynthesis